MTAGGMMAEGRSARMFRVARKASGAAVLRAWRHASSPPERRVGAIRRGHRPQVREGEFSEGATRVSTQVARIAAGGRPRSGHEAHGPACGGGRAYPLAGAGHSAGNAPRAPFRRAAQASDRSARGAKPSVVRWLRRGSARPAPAAAAPRRASAERSSVRYAPRAAPCARHPYDHSSSALLFGTPSPRAVKGPPVTKMPRAREVFTRPGTYSCNVAGSSRCG